MSANFTKGDVGEANKDASGLSAAQVYLLTYNSGCAMGWYFVLFKMGSAFIDGGGIQEVVNAAHDVVAVLQLISTLEILHSSVRLVRMENVVMFLSVLHSSLFASPWGKLLAQLCSFSHATWGTGAVDLMGPSFNVLLEISADFEEGCSSSREDLACFQSDILKSNIEVLYKQSGV